MITIVVPVHNGERTLEGCLRGLCAQTGIGDYEILVINDGSTDRTPQIIDYVRQETLNVVDGRQSTVDDQKDPVNRQSSIVRRPSTVDRRPSIQVAETSHNPEPNTQNPTPTIRRIDIPHSGASVARNHGIREAKGDIVLFTDADCTPAHDWASMLCEPLREGTAKTQRRQADSSFFGSEELGEARAGLVDSTDRKGEKEIEPSRLSALAVGSPISGVVGRCESRQENWVAALIQVELDERYSAMSHHERIDFLNTGNCAFRRDLLLENLFDESFPWLEDVELSYRLAHNGHQMVYVPDARVEHPHPESFWAYLKRKFHYASCAPEIYRRYPEKAVSDSRTPVSRKLQLLLLAAAVLGFGCWVLGVGFWMLGSGLWGLEAGDWRLGTGGLSFLPFLLGLSLVCLLAAVGFSLPVVRRAFRRSFVLGLLSPFFVLAGNLSFVLGAARGVIGRRLTAETQRR